MPWNARTALEQRKEFVEEWRLDPDDFAELCRKYGVSRQTGYKWVKRFETQGVAGLEDLSRAPRESPQAIGAEVAARLIGLREEHPRWGPRKLRAYLESREPGQHWPATSSIGGLLQREGLVQARRLRRRTPRYSEPLAHVEGPNQVWCADFKGWFLCGNGERCDPLTISDAYSRYLLRCRAVEKTDGVHVRAIFEAVFRECGLPEAIRTDNGPPFVAPAPAGLSRLGMWWLRLGIRQERIEPGHPEQNGRHERMHQTLQQETATPPAANLRQQQQVFLRFQDEYNQQRPHEALQYRTPASLYTTSRRCYPARLPELQYPENAQLRKVADNGLMYWKCRRVFVSHLLGGEWVGLVPSAEDFYEVYYGPLLLGWFDAQEFYFAADVGAEPKRRRRRQA
jgi:transposase InsO family protein